MNGINFQASLHNLTQVDRIQQSGHQTPVVDQQINAEKAREEAAKRIYMPTQPDKTEEKTVNPAKSNKENPAKKRRKNMRREQPKRQAKRNTGTGGHIDFIA
jgi:hypothetical protein